MIDILSVFAPYGPWVLLSVLIFLAYDRLVKQTIGIAREVMDVVANNTKATGHMSDIATAICQDLSEHDRKVESSRVIIARTGETVERMERRLDAIHERVSSIGDRATERARRADA